jgi:hypothetical protein
VIAAAATSAGNHFINDFGAKRLHPLASEPVAKVGYCEPSVRCNRLLLFLRLKPYETCDFKRLLLQN